MMSLLQEEWSRERDVSAHPHTHEHTRANVHRNRAYPDDEFALVVADIEDFGLEVHTCEYALLCAYVWVFIKET